MRLGHEHLDAILNRSGHILEAQHVDLIRGDPSRSHSRSSSVSLTPRNWASDESDKSSTSDSEDVVHLEAEFDQELGDVEDENEHLDAGTSGLLNEFLTEPDERPGVVPET